MRLLSADGTVEIADAPDIGLPVDEAFIKAHAYTPGRSFI